MLTVLAIDPGPQESAAVLYDQRAGILATWMLPNMELRNALLVSDALQHDADLLAVEQIGHYGTGMPAGREVFDTSTWIGRFLELWSAWRTEESSRLILRATIKTHLCGSARAKDPNVRQALLDLPRWQSLPQGEGANPVVGTKSKPGPLYGISKHLWSALAVAVVAADREAVLTAEETR